MKVRSVCLNTFCNKIVLLITVFQHCDSKQNFIGGPFLSGTGATYSNLSRKAPSSIETSSIIRTLVLLHFSLFSGDLLAALNASSLDPLAIPHPENLLMVKPPILTAAKPVDAVTATVFAPYNIFNLSTSSLNKTDFPVPALPV
ncbi:hypothetical protein WICMUC_003918 [Wickerhamomyces mucosus]|uniref:Uncharacterized protein n=1 Tax=Wickerhamomyces mucosus TaxID=1378264 RepID=A0A9P8TC51_9ASCO|nr:hypothetical protein WICMUC_003918 [Wickerhamomyces mucosus]